MTDPAGRVFAITGASSGIGEATALAAAVAGANVAPGARRADRLEDIAAGILYAVSQPPRVGVKEVLIRPSRQRE